MQRITHDQFKAMLTSQGVPRQHWALTCPICSTVQSFALLEREGVPENNLEGQLGFSCVGRWNGAGQFKPAGPKKVGCNWTLGGLFQLHKMEVELDGQRHPTFVPSTPEQARELMAKLDQADG
jgi:hypothetical protein